MSATRISTQLSSDLSDEQMAEHTSIMNAGLRMRYEGLSV